MKLPRPLVLASGVAVAAFTLLAAGCGGGGSPSAGVASVPSTTTSSSTAAASQSGLLAFSRCMRTHGMPNFPEPQRYVGGNLKLTIHQNGNSPQFQAAMTACNALLPPNQGPAPSEAQTRTQLADQLSFARCMRSHGVSRFPDPTAQAQLSVAMVEAQGIDVHSPQILRIVQTCLPASHGGLTAAKVREALENNPGP